MHLGGCIYAIGTQRYPYVKIGCTNGSAQRRLLELQKGSLDSLFLIASIDVVEDRYQIEGRIHVTLAPYRVYGEWFRCDMTRDRLAMLVREAQMLLAGNVHPGVILKVLGAILADETLTSAEKLVLVTLAHETDPLHGVACPSRQRLLTLTSLPSARLAAVVKTVTAKGYLGVERGKGVRKGYIYTINLRRLGLQTGEGL